jgi:hypothetical protein
MTPPKKYMYVNPMGMPIREITSVNVALKANVRSPTCAFLGSIRFADASMGRTVDEPMKKRMKVATKQTSKFRRLWELLVSVDNTAPGRDSIDGRYLGRLVLRPALAS